MNKQYTTEERTNYLAEWRESGKSGGQFCREKDIRPTTFYNWTKKERQKQKVENSGLVKLSKLEITAPRNNIALEYGGWNIILQPGFNREDAIAVMNLVEEKSVS